MSEHGPNMTDELVTLSELMEIAARDVYPIWEDPHDQLSVRIHYGCLDEASQACAQVAIDFFAGRLARAEAIEAAARKRVAGHKIRLTDYGSICDECHENWPCKDTAELRAALEDS